MSFIYEIHTLFETAAKFFQTFPLFLFYLKRKKTKRVFSRIILPAKLFLVQNNFTFDILESGDGVTASPDVLINTLAGIYLIYR